MKVMPDHTLESCPAASTSWWCRAGGARAREMKNARLVAWIKERAKQVETLTSVCTGSMLLGQAGLLDGRHATTHWRALEWMRDSFRP
jgi:transcriptional regulator GlxA family with amidase domain